MNKKALIILSVLVISLLGGLVYGVGLSKNNKKEISNVDNSLKNDMAISSTMGTTTNNAIKTSNDTIKENKVVSGGNEVKANTDTKTESKVENTVSSNTNSSSKAENVSVSNNNSSSKPNNTVSSKPSNNTSSNNNSSSTNNNSSSNSNTSSKPSTPAHTHTWKDETKVVHHDEEGYWDTVVVKEAWVEEVPKYEQKVLSICNGCGKDITGNIDAHLKSEMLAGNMACGGYHSEVRQVQVGVDKINHPAVTEKKWVVSKPAWDETIVVGSVCSGCGAKK